MLPGPGDCGAAEIGVRAPVADRRPVGDNAVMRSLLLTRVVAAGKLPERIDGLFIMEDRAGAGGARWDDFR